MTVPARGTVLVCDDDAQILRALKVLLRDAGFGVMTSTTVREAIDTASLRPPDAAIIDLVLPDGDGVAVCVALRSWTDIPIIVLSAIDDEDGKVRALDAGADDYVTKPFAPRELIARLSAALRRAGGPEEPLISVEGMEIDIAARAVRVSGEPVHLTPKEYALLLLLARNRGRLMTAGSLLREIWGPGYVSDTQVLRAHVARLRAKIEPSSGPKYIKTDPGVGYRFMG